MRVIVIEAPAPVVTWEDADAHLELSGDVSQQVKVEGYIAAACEHLDGPEAEAELGRALGLQTLEARFDMWEIGCGLKLPCPPVVDLVRVSYLDVNRQEITVDPSDYELIDRTVYPIAASWPWEGGYWGREAVRVRYRAGYVKDPDADPIVSTLPAPIRAAILLMLGDLYANRETVAVGVSATPIGMSTTVEALLGPYRIFS